MPWARFMDEVGVERATLLGNSLGCPIIGEFLDHFPDRAERVIFVSPAGGLYNQPFPKGLSQLIVDTLREPPGMGKFVVSDYLAYGPVAIINLIRSMLALPDHRADRQADAADARRAGQPRPVRQRTVGQATRRSACPTSRG